MNTFKRLVVATGCALLMGAALVGPSVAQQLVQIAGMSSGTLKPVTLSSSGALNVTFSGSGGGTWAFGTLANDAQAINATATEGSVPTGPLTVYQFTATGAGSASQAVYAFGAALAAGYTGSSDSAGLRATNATIGTGNTYGVLSLSSGATTGVGVGVSGQSTGGTKNVGGYFSSAGPFTTTAVPFTGGVSGIAGAFYNGTNSDDLLVGSDGTTTPLEVFRAKNGGDWAYASETGDAALQFDWTATSGGGNVRLLVSGGSSASFGTTNNIPLQFTANGTDRWDITTSGHLIAHADNSYSIGLTGATRPTAIFLSAPAITVGSGTGVTVNDSGSVRTLTYKVTIASTAFVCANTVCDVTIGTLPSNSRLESVDANLTQVFACTATCVSTTLSMMLGKGSGGAEYLASGLDVDAATAWFGDADAELGSLMTRAAAIQGGTMNTGSTQAVVMRLTSGSGNIGNGSVTNLSQGSIAFHLKVRVPA
jgi:hypothetical protein